MNDWATQVPLNEDEERLLPGIDLIFEMLARGDDPAYIRRVAAKAINNNIRRAHAAAIAADVTRFERPN